MQFCSTSLGCKIDVDKPSVDGYEVSNLIMCNKGFMCESFVRPPVNIKIDFPVPIDISSVALQTQMRERKSTGFKISTLITSYNTDLLLPSSHKNCTNEGSTVKIGCASATDSKGSEECCVGKWFSINEANIVLKNYHYKHWISYPLPPETTKSSECFNGALRCANRMAMKSVNSLIITISNVRPIGSPVLKGIQVWGQPSINCSPSQKKKIFLLWTKQLKEFSSKQNNLPVIEYYDVKHQENEETVSPDLAIPDEFLDPLTCEIMKLPILLPSGNSIDSSSLERFIFNESMWGRSASDPFTGVLFKQTYKPEPNIHLKARIDRFILIENNLPRSLLDERGHMVTDTDTDTGTEDSAPKSQSMTSTRKPEHESHSRSKRLKRTLSHSTESSNSTNNPRPKSPSHSSSVSTKDGMQFSQRTFAKPCFPSSSTNPSTSVVKSISKSNPPSTSVQSDSTSKKNTGHSLIQSLGTALSSTSKKQSYAKPKLKPINNNNVDLQTSNSKELEPSSSSIPDTEKYSLLGLSRNPLRCFCGNRAGVFYSLSCSHKMCGVCVKSGTAKTDTLSCGECGFASRRQQLCRVHPQSAFAR